MRVSVIGGSEVNGEIYGRAREVGRRLGDRDHEVVCGGYGGVMEAACRGASEAGGHTIDGAAGTLSELGLAFVYDRPVAVSLPSTALRSTASGRWRRRSRRSSTSSGLRPSPVRGRTAGKRGTDAPGAGGGDGYDVSSE